VHSIWEAEQPERVERAETPQSRSASKCRRSFDRADEVIE